MRGERGVGEVRTGLQRPYERAALCDERPARAEAQQPDALVAGAGAEQVAHECRAPVIDQTDDRDGGEQRERVLRDP